MKAVLRAEVCDQRVARARIRRGEVGIEALEHLVVTGQVLRICGGSVELFLLDTAQHEAGVTSRLLPQGFVEVLEQGAGGSVPAEEQVRGELRQPRKHPRNNGGDIQERISHEI